MLTKEGILGLVNVETKVVLIEAWNDEVTIKKLTIKERDVVDSIMYAGTGPKDIKAGKIEISTDVYYRVSLKAVSFALLDEDGKTMFSEDELYAMSDSARSGISEVYTALQEFDTPKKLKKDDSSSD